jgi:hypothetical protein
VPPRRNVRPKNCQFSLSINRLPVPPGEIASSDVFLAVPAHSPAIGSKPINRQRLASRFWRPAFVIARSGGDEAIVVQLLGLLRFARNDDITHRLSNPLSFVGAVRNDDAKPLDLFAAVSEAHLQFKPIVVGGIRFRPTERDQGWKFSRQALLDIGRFECRAAHGDSAVLGATERRIAGNGPAVQSARMLV